MPLGENLIKKGFLTKDQLEKALKEQEKSSGEKIGQILIRLGFVTKEQVESSL
jgi:type IV pilus assembly protein PilB